MKIKKLFTIFNLQYSKQMTFFPSLKMHIGICVIELLIRESQSLKEKRRAIKSIKDRVRNQFNVSIAEVEKLNNRQEATLGIACVSNDSKHANSMLSNIVNFVEGSHLVEVLSYNIEVIY